MNVYNIWAEPYLATGMEGIPSQPIIVARGVEGETFEEACDTYCAIPENIEGFGEYNPIRRSLWGCKLHPTREEAEAPWAELRNRNN